MVSVGPLECCQKRRRRKLIEVLSKGWIHRDHGSCLDQRETYSFQALFVKFGAGQISFRQVFEPKLEWSSLVQLVHSAKGAISVQHPDGWRELSGQSL